MSISSFHHHFASSSANDTIIYKTPYLPILYSQLGYNKSIDIQEQRLIYIELKEEKIARTIPPHFEISRNVNDR